MTVYPFFLSFFSRGHNRYLFQAPAPPRNRKKEGGGGILWRGKKGGEEGYTHGRLLVVQHVWCTPRNNEEGTAAAAPADMAAL